MIKIQNLNAPETWHDVTINQLLLLQKIDSNDLASNLKLIQVFNPDVSDPYALDIVSIIECATAIYSVIGKQPNVLPVDKYFIDGKEYKVNAPDSIDFGQFIDVTALRSDDETEQLKNMALIIAIITDGITDPREFAEIVADKLDIETGSGIVLFFSENLKNYILNSPLYSHIMKTLKKETK